MEQALVYPAAERRHDLVDVALPDDEIEEHSIPDDLVAPARRRPTSSGSRTTCAVWEEEGLDPVDLTGAAELDPFPRGQPLHSKRNGPR